MAKHGVRMAILGLTASVAVLAAAAEPQLDWPQEWTVFGPIPSKTYGTSLYGRPLKADLLAGPLLKTMPRELVIDGKKYRGQPFRLEEGLLDLNRKLKCGGDGTGAYLFASVTVSADTTVEIGAGADWWMQWWLDGQPVFDTLGRGHLGNATTPISGRDHVFSLRLTKGSHVLAVAVFGYRRLLFAAMSPRQLQEHPLSFQEAMAAGRRKYMQPHWSIAVPFADARADFERAVKLASTEALQAEARLAVAESHLLDAQNLAPSNVAAIRQQYDAIAGLRKVQTDQRARAALGLGELCLLDGRCDQARTEFAKAEALYRQPHMTATVRLATARAWAQEKNFAQARAALAPLLSDAKLERATRFSARMLSEAVDVAPRIRPDHPRLFFNAETWPGVRARVEQDVQGLRRLKQFAKGLPEITVRDWGPELMQVALLYRVTPDAALLAKIRKMLRATIDHYLLLLDFNNHMEPRVGCAAALDWVWNDLPAAEREVLAHDLLRYAYGRHLQDMLRGPGQADHDPYYYVPNMYWYIGLATLHPEMTGVDYLRALAILGRGYDNNVVACFGDRIALMKDRGGVTRVEYNFQDLPTPVWTFLHCWRSAVGPIPAEWDFASGLAPSYMLRRILGFAKDHYRHFGHAHSWKKKDGWQTAYRVYDNLGQFIYFFSKSQPEEAAIAAYLRRQMEQVGCTDPGSYPIYPYVLDFSQSPAPKLPDGLPLARHYSVNGLVLMGSGFDPGATRALFSCGGGQGEHLDTAHFTIFKRGYLALDSGTRALVEVNPEGENYDKQSVAHNTVLIHMPGEKFKCLTNPTRDLDSNSGGQCKLPQFARVLAFRSTPLFAYVATDATPTYHPEKCAEMIRQFLFLSPDCFVVFDRVASKKAEYPKTWLLHTANEPVIAGKEFRADQEQGRIFCRTLYPTDAVLEKIGGPGKEFWADGRNWPIPAYSPYFRTIGIKDASDVAENMGRWRVEVKPGAARTHDVLLHLIQVADRTVPRMIESRVSEVGGRIQVSFTAAARTYTIGFNPTGDVGGHIRIDEGGKTLLDAELTRKVQRQNGLALTSGPR